MDQRKPPVYDEQKRSRASITAVLRSIVAFYLAYLGFTIAQNSGGPDTTMQPWMGWTVFAVFTAVGIAFGVYTLKRYQIDLKNAEISSQGTPPGAPERKTHED